MPKFFIHIIKCRLQIAIGTIDPKSTVEPARSAGQDYYKQFLFRNWIYSTYVLAEFLSFGRVLSLLYEMSVQPIDLLPNKF